tara:strand:+ start:143 stop:364 length:222 start_codon:yes stop_codon:yes gene_type:complete
MYDEEIKANCNGCGKESEMTRPIQYHMWARNDAYGIYTGLYCSKCYDDPTIYTYRKDEYFDEAYAGERLEEDY